MLEILKDKTCLRVENPVEIVYNYLKRETGK